MKFFKGHQDQRFNIVWTEVVEMTFLKNLDQCLWVAKIGTYLKKSHIQVQLTTSDFSDVFTFVQQFYSGYRSFHFINKLAAVISDETMAALVRRKLRDDHEATITAVRDDISDEALAELIRMKLSEDREATLQMMAQAIIATEPKEPPEEEQEKEAEAEAEEIKP